MSECGLATDAEGLSIGRTLTVSKFELGCSRPSKAMSPSLVTWKVVGLIRVVMKPRRSSLVPPIRLFRKPGMWRQFSSLKVVLYGPLKVTWPMPMIGRVESPPARSSVSFRSLILV